MKSPTECETFCFKLKEAKLLLTQLNPTLSELSSAAGSRKDKRLQKCKEMKSKLERVENNVEVDLKLH